MQIHLPVKKGTDRLHIHESRQHQQAQFQHFLEIRH
jgi:hypothetical protein